MKTTDLYVFQTTEIEHMKTLLEKAFQIKFVPHDSYHYGAYYLFKSGGTEDETFMLMENIMFEGELHYPEFPENTVMLSIGFTIRGGELESTLKNFGAKLIERQGFRPKA